MQPQPPIPPIAPVPLAPDAPDHERNRYMAGLVAYNADRLVYEHAVARYNRAMLDYLTGLNPAGIGVPASPVPPPAVIGDPHTTPAPAPAAPPAPPPIEFEGRLYLQPSAEGMARLSLAVNLANAAIARGVNAGDYRWMSADRDFTWPDQSGTPVRMDHQTLIALAQVVANAA